LDDAKENAVSLIKKSTIPGTSIAPINVADVQVDTSTGNVVVTVVEDFSAIKVDTQYTNNSNSTVSSGNTER